MKRARKALAGYTADYGCEPDEETYALLAGGWSRAGKIRESADVVLSLAQKGFDPAQIKLNDLVSDWNNGKWRQVLSPSLFLLFFGLSRSLCSPSLHPSLCTHSHACARAHTHTYMRAHIHTHMHTHQSVAPGSLSSLQKRHNNRLPPNVPTHVSTRHLPPDSLSLLCLNSLRLRLIITTDNGHAHLRPGEGLRNEIAKRHRRAGMDGDAVEEEEEENYEEAGIVDRRVQ